MTTETVEITEEEARIIREAIDSGRFQSVSDVVRAGVRLLADQLDEDRRNEEKLRAILDEAAAVGVSERTPREIFAAVRAKHTADDA